MKFLFLLLTSVSGILIAGMTILNSIFFVVDTFIKRKN